MVEIIAEMLPWRRIKTRSTAGRCPYALQPRLCDHHNYTIINLTGDKQSIIKMDETLKLSNEASVKYNVGVYASTSHASTYKTYAWSRRFMPLRTRHMEPKSAVYCIVIIIYR